VIKILKNEKMKELKLRILIVEDETMAAIPLKAQLQAFGYQHITIVNDADDALAIFKNDTPDLVLLDIRLEGSKMDGIDLAEQFNAVSRVPIIFTSASEDAPTLQRVRDVRPANFLPKPITPTQLKIALDLAIDVFESQSLFENDALFVKGAAGITKKLLSNRVVFHKQGNILELVSPDDIVYCVAFGDMTRVFLKDYRHDEKGKGVPTFTAHRQLGFYEIRLIRDFDFFRNLNYLQSYSHNNRELKLANGDILTAARLKSQSLKNFLGGE
jgi:CheY-like chemotaxis protein